MPGTTAATTLRRPWRDPRQSVDKCDDKMPEFAEFLDLEAEDTLAMMNYPKAFREQLNTTNGVQRINQEIKAQDPGGADHPARPDSCLRLVLALTAEQHEDWISGRRNLNATRLEERSTTYTSSSVVSSSGGELAVQLGYSGADAFSNQMSRYFGHRGGEGAFLAWSRASLPRVRDTGRGETILSGHIGRSPG